MSKTVFDLMHVPGYGMPAGRNKFGYTNGGDRVNVKKGGWIKKAVKKPGALRKSLGVKKGQKIPAAKLKAAAKKGGKMGQRARLAMTLKKLNRKKS